MEILRRQRWYTQLSTQGGLAHLDSVASTPVASSNTKTEDQDPRLLSAREILAAGEALLKDGQALNASQDEYWSVLEQVVLAALECQQPNVATTYLKVLEKRFPKSVRVQRLHGHLLEYQRQYKDAVKLYNQILDDDATILWAHKRLIAVHLAADNQDLVAATKALHKYLEYMPSDTEAWECLMCVYSSRKEWSRALWCVEELLVLRPTHYGYAELYADLWMKCDQWAMAKKYYCFALELQAGNRALWGKLVQCLEKLESKQDKHVLSLIDQELLAMARSKASGI